MNRTATCLILLMFLTPIACDEADDPPADGSQADAAPTDAAPTDAAPTDAAPTDAASPVDGGSGFGAECSGDPDCGVGLVCRTVGMLGMVCTAECSDDDACPPGSMGPKCNMMGLCRP